MTKTMLVGALALVVGSTAFAQEKKQPPPAAGGEKKAAPAAKGPEAAPAAAAKPAGPPAPAPELVEASKYFLGKWKCDGSMPEGPWGPAAKATTNLTFKMEMGNFFLGIDGDMKTDAKPPMKMMFKGMNGYDATSKKMMRMDWDSMGGMAMLSSAGWEGDKMVFSGDATMMGQKTKMRHTMTKKSDTEFTSSMESQGPDGKWMSMGEDTCKKAGGKK